VPRDAAPPAEVLRHYRQFSWVGCEQRLMALLTGAMLASCALVWTAALRLGARPPVVVRAAPSLKEAASAFHGAPEISYDQVAFFLSGCLPLLYAAGEGGHPLLPLVQGMVAPEIYGEAERRLAAAESEVKANGMTQALAIDRVGDVVADAASGRASARLAGRVVVTLRRGEARSFPWSARVLVEVNPASRLDPYPFYLVRFEPGSGGEPAAP
jgi:hypothetical protein